MQNSLQNKTIEDCRYETLFRELYISQRENLYVFLSKKLDDDSVAEDILHDVFLKFWLIRESYDCIENHQAFLFRMALNEVITYFKRQKNLRTIYKAVSASNDGYFNSTDEIVYQKELEIILQKTIDQLSPRKKQVYVLCKLQGLPIKQVASILNMSPITVKNTMWNSNEVIRSAVNRWNDTNRNRKYRKSQGLDLQTI